MQNPDPNIVERYKDGWRSGKPVEDPDKLKRWGYIGAKPSEYLVCTRGGAIARTRSGQGMRIFKWPWESVAIVPTTLQRIEFVADQVTREKIGVEIAGVAVYRIADPEIAFRVLNFTYGEAASEKLAATLREMFVGAARRLVANLSLDDCLTRRKETIGTFLLEEIAPVVGGKGALDDTTSRGWGVVIDTIEIQQVRVLSSHVFAHLQAPFRAEIAARAELADLDRARQVAEVTAQQAARDAEVARERALHGLRVAEEHRRAKAAAEVAALEAEQVRARAVQAAAVAELEHAQAIAQRETAHAVDVRRAEAQLADYEGELAVQQQRRLAEIEKELASVRVQRELVANALPAIAKALAHDMQHVSITQIGVGDPATNPLAAVPTAFAQLLAIAKSFGVVPGEVTS